MSGRDRPTRVGGRRAHGQHFLRGRRLAASIVEGAGIEPGDLVLDLGAGTGLLTAELAARGATVVAVELDPRLAASLRERFSRNPNVAVVETDARGVVLPAEPFKVLANLPFGIATDVLRALLDDPTTLLRAADLVVQWELAVKRAAVWPSTLLGVYWGAWYELSLDRRLPPAAFAPPPAVAAGVLRVARRSSSLVPEADHAAYQAFLRSAFRVPGAPLRAALRGAIPPLRLKRLAGALGFASEARARDLDARQWAALFAARAVRPIR